MIKINKNERDYLVNECGFEPGYHISRTYTHNPHYYASENKKVIDALNKYREEHTICATAKM